MKTAEMKSESRIMNLSLKKKKNWSGYLRIVIGIYEELFISEDFMQAFTKDLSDAKSFVISLITHVRLSKHLILLSAYSCKINNTCAVEHTCISCIPELFFLAY